MRLTVPLTGTVVTNPDGSWSGHPDDPIRPCDIDFGKVSWQMVELDLDAGTMTIEVTPSPVKEVDTGQVDAKGQKVYQTVPATDADKQAFLDFARSKVEGKTHDQIRAEHGKAPLKRQGVGI